MLAILTFVFFMILISYVLYLTYQRLYSPYYTGQYLLTKPVKMGKDLTLCNKEVISSGDEHTISFWIFIENWEYTDNSKVIFKREYSNGVMQVELDQKYPHLHILQLDKKGKNILKGANNAYAKYTFRHVPVQSWVQISLTFWNQSIDVYMNGKLAASFVTFETLIPTEGHHKVTLGGEDTFIGFASRMKYYPRVVSPKELYNLYLIGPADSSDLSKNSNISTRMNINLGLTTSPGCQTAK